MEVIWHWKQETATNLLNLRQINHQTEYENLQDLAVQHRPKPAEEQVQKQSTHHQSANKVSWEEKQEIGR